jgi:phospho-N-acetylmuramoyl-pentapeptide-transferase
MLKWLIACLAEYEPSLLVLNDFVIRAIGSAATSLILSLILGNPFIKWLKTRLISQQIRQDGPESHFSKQQTPTMGGLMMLFVIVVTVLLWADWQNFFIWTLLLITIGFGLIGLADDGLKFMKKQSKGLSASIKYLGQSIMALVGLGISYWWLNPYMVFQLEIPFSDWVLPLGFGFLILNYFVLVGASNAVNLTDGLDGLVVMPVILVSAGLGLFAYFSSNPDFADYFDLVYIPASQEILIFAMAICGSGLGFLWYNAYPAELFMGDVGSLALGACLGMMAILLRKELVFFIMGLVFVVEALSVILQVGSFKLRKKRIFKMAPIHHHYELKGLTEPKIVTRFWIVSVCCVLIGLVSLK